MSYSTQEVASSCSTSRGHGSVSFTCFTSRRTASRLWESPSCRMLSLDLARCSGVLPARSKASTLAPAGARRESEGCLKRLGNASRAGAGCNCSRGNVTSAQQRGDDGNVVRAGSWGGKTQDTQLRGSSKQQNFCSGVQLATFPRLFAMRKSPTVKCHLMLKPGYSLWDKSWGQQRQGNGFSLNPTRRPHGGRRD